MTNARRPRVWIVGATDGAELQPLLARFATLAPLRFASSRQTTRPVEQDPPGAETAGGSEWVVFLSERPESVGRETVERWQRWFPLARFVVVLGTWCEGESRTGRPWPGVARMYWHEAEAQLLAPLAHFVDEPLEWRLPRTATEVERILAATPSRPSLVERTTFAPGDHETGDAAAGETRQDGEPALQVAIYSATRGGWEAVRDAAEICGASARRWTGATAEFPDLVDAALIDVEDASDLQTAPWRDGPWRTRRIPTLVLFGFPRWEDYVKLAESGAELLPKPWRLADLARWLATCRARVPQLPNGDDVTGGAEKSPEI